MDTSRYILSNESIILRIIIKLSEGNVTEKGKVSELGL